MSDTQCAQQGQLLVAHDLKRLATRKSCSLRGRFAAWVSVYDTNSSRRRGCDRNGNGGVRPPQYRWTTPADEDRYAPASLLGRCVSSSFFVAVLRVVQKLAKQGPAP
jgi:hypothetical protein